MSDTCRVVMTEHAAWRSTRQRQHRVFVMPDGGKWLVTVYGHKVVTRPLVPGGSEPTPTFFTFPTGAGRNVPQLCGALMSLGSVARFRTPDLWDAIGTAIIRQVIRAGHAKRLYRAFCDAYGSAAAAQTRKPTHSSRPPRPCLTSAIHSSVRWG
jgi:DNA-3-methyladenine glycosylase II